MPTIRAGADWARLLYFDLKRLELRLFTNLRKRFERHTLQLAWLLAVVFWVVAAAIVTAYYGREAGLLVAALFAFFVARSLLARAQIQAFAEGAYGPVLGTGFLCLVGLGAVGPLADSEAERMAGDRDRCRSLRDRALPASRDGAQARRAGDGAPHAGVAAAARAPAHAGPRRLGASRLLGRARADGDAHARGPQPLAPLAARRANRSAAGKHRGGGVGGAGPRRVVRAADDRRVDADWLQRVSGGLVARDRRARVCERRGGAARSRPR